MNNHQLFTNPEYQIPIRFSTDDFKSEVSNLLTAYIKDLESLGVDEKTIKVVKQFRFSCAYTISNYLRGIHSNAFENFEKAVEALGILDSPLLSAELGEETIYRGRENKNDPDGAEEDFSDDQMFHIPLNKRGIITTQRYSFPGLPCLYAGASVYTCWVEMNRPAFEQFQVATIRITDAAQKETVLDLSHIPQRLAELDHEVWFDMEEYLRYWPLLALCSIKVRNESQSFKPEYIFPQFLLEYILKKKAKYVGIKYASIKVAGICEKQFLDNWHTYVNYVFPTHSDSMSDEKCSFLGARFKVQKTRSGKELQILSRLLEMEHAKLKVGINDGTVSMNYLLYANNWKVYMRDGKTYPYASSVFGMIEEAMSTGFRIESDSERDS